MRYCKSFLDYMSEFLLQGASNTWEGKGQASLPGAAVGVCRVACVRTQSGCSYGGVARSIVGAPPRCEAKSDQHTEPVRWHPGRVLLQGGVARSIVGAPPRCEAKSNQYTEPAHSHPGRVLLQGGGDAFSCRSTASVRSEVKPIQRARPFAPGAGAPTGWGGAFDCRSTASVRTESNQYTEPAHSHPGRVLLRVLRGNEKAPASFDARAFDMAQRTGLEPATPGVTGRYSNRLNYRCASV